MLVTYILPAHWASYLINEDASGLTKAEKASIDAFLKQEEIFEPAISCSEDSWFAKSNDANEVGGDVMEFIFDVPPPTSYTEE